MHVIAKFVVDQNRRNRPCIIDIEKGIFLLNLSATAAKYFPRTDIICFSKCTIISTREAITNPCVGKVE